jgi:hypothetical protein
VKGCWVGFPGILLSVRLLFTFGRSMRNARPLRRVPGEPLHRDIQSHLETIRCRLCGATVTELEEAQSAGSNHPAQRRRRYFESPAGHLRRD